MSFTAGKDATVPPPAKARREALGVRILSSVVLIVVIVAAIALGRPYFNLLVAASVATLSWEWARLCGGVRFGATGATLAVAVLAAVGIDASVPVVTAGLQGCPEFSSTFLGNSGNLEHDEVQREVVSVVKGLIERHPDVGALLFECSDIPAYAWAAQLEVRLPIWDYSTLIRWIYDGVVRTPFSGYPGDFATTAPAALGRNGRSEQAPSVGR